MIQESGNYPKSVTKHWDKSEIRSQDQCFRFKTSFNWRSF